MLVGLNKMHQTLLRYNKCGLPFSAPHQFKERLRPEIVR